MIYLTDEENRLVEDFIWLPYAKRVLENDRKAIQQSGVKFQGVYLNNIDHALNRITTQLRNVRRLVIRHNMKIIKLSDLCYLILCRGYEENIKWIPSIAAQLVKSRIENYLLAIK